MSKKSKSSKRAFTRLLLGCIFFFFPLASFADYGEGFLVTDCSNHESFSISYKMLWNEDLAAAAPAISRHDGILKQGTKQLKHLLTVGGDVASDCQISNHQLEVRFYGLNSYAGAFDLVDNGVIEATYKVENNNRIFDEKNFRLKYTPQTGWEILCGNEIGSTRWFKTGKNDDDKQIKNGCGFSREDYKYPNGVDWRPIRLMRPVCNGVILRSQFELTKAIKSGNTELAEKLLETVPSVNYVGKAFEQQPLHWAVQKSNLPLVKSLLERGADPNAVNCRGDTVLITALRQREHATSNDITLDVTRMLLSKGANPNAAAAYLGIPPLSFAASHGDVEALKLLLDVGADPNLAGDASQSSLPIFSALSVLNKNQLEIFRLLLERGANPNARSFDYSILSEAIGCIYPHPGQEDQRLLLVRLLLQHGADSNLPSNGVLPLTCASSLGFEKIRQELHSVAAK